LDERIHHPMQYPLVRCPACGSSDLDAVVEDVMEDVHFLCGDCNRCWNIELGSVKRVAPAACFGCPERDRCERAYAVDRHRNTES
jgi:transposase-like protein